MVGLGPDSPTSHSASHSTTTRDAVARAERLLRKVEHSTEKREASWPVENSFSVTVGSSQQSPPINSNPNSRSRDLVINRYMQGHTHVHTIISELLYKDQNGYSSPPVPFTSLKFPHLHSKSHDTIHRWPLPGPSDHLGSQDSYGHSNSPNT